MGALGWIVTGVVFLALATLLAWLGAKDRRWLFVGIAVYVLVPLLVSFGLPRVKVTPIVQDLYDFIEGIPESRVVLLTCDYDPGSKPELHPMTYAIMDHLCRRNLKFAVMELWPQGPGMANDVLENVARRKYGKKDRIDFAHLGYKTGQEVVIRSLGNSIAGTYPTDVDGVPVESIPVLKGIQAVRDFAIIISISAGTPGAVEWVQQAGSQYHIPVAGGVTGVSAPMVLPYYPGQVIGLLGGLAAAAEYERLVAVPGTATQGMEAQSFSHALIILFVIFGNVVYFWTRSRGGSSR